MKKQQITTSELVTNQELKKELGKFLSGVVGSKSSEDLIKEFPQFEKSFKEKVEKAFPTKTIDLVQFHTRQFGNLFLLAINASKKEFALELLKRNPEINSAKESLKPAIRKNMPAEILSYIYQQSKDLRDFKNEYLLEAFKYLSHQNRTEFFAQNKILLVDIKDYSNAENLLHYAVRNKDPKFLEGTLIELEKKGLLQNLVKEQNSLGLTPLNLCSFTQLNCFAGHGVDVKAAYKVRAIEKEQKREDDQQRQQALQISNLQPTATMIPSESREHPNVIQQQLDAQRVSRT